MAHSNSKSVLALVGIVINLSLSGSSQCHLVQSLVFIQSPTWTSKVGSPLLPRQHFMPRQPPDTFDEPSRYVSLIFPKANRVFSLYFSEVQTSDFRDCL